MLTSEEEKPLEKHLTNPGMNQWDYFEDQSAEYRLQMGCLAEVAL